MQITLDIPDELYSEASALADQQTRSLASVLLDFLQGGRKASGKAESTLTPEWELPVVKGARPFTVDEIEKLLAEDGLP